MFETIREHERGNRSVQRRPKTAERRKRRERREGRRRLEDYIVRKEGLQGSTIKGSAYVAAAAQRGYSAQLKVRTTTAKIYSQHEARPSPPRPGHIPRPPNTPQPPMALTCTRADEYTDTHARTHTLHTHAPTHTHAHIYKPIIIPCHYLPTVS